jgi:hypothetical protein
VVAVPPSLLLPTKGVGCKIEVLAKKKGNVRWGERQRRFGSSFLANEGGAYLRGAPPPRPGGGCASNAVRAPAQALAGESLTCPRREAGGSGGPGATHTRH